MPLTPQERKGESGRQRRRVHEERGNKLRKEDQTKFVGSDTGGPRSKGGLYSPTFGIGQQSSVLKSSTMTVDVELWGEGESFRRVLENFCIKGYSHQPYPYFS